MNDAWLKNRLKDPVFYKLYHRARGGASRRSEEAAHGALFPQVGRETSFVLRERTHGQSQQG